MRNREQGGFDSGKGTVDELQWDTNGRPEDHHHQVEPFNQRLRPLPYFDNWSDYAYTASNYSDRATSNTAEPVTVLELGPGTYGVRVKNPTSEGTSNINFEFYVVND